ncbi:hypothetical protein Taro_027269 [Colocasia esculenta]|uniref:Uncharacterized protein n=1 Tax=Colocasia esculenta TaxID=4460 RepID=A0A843VFA9_COLES|nr:hypothetical protein [Colocasia esculenta]
MTQVNLPYEEGDISSSRIQKVTPRPSRLGPSTGNSIRSQFGPMLLMVFKGQSKVRLLPLGRLRSRKTKNPSLHPLEKKATTDVS